MKEKFTNWYKLKYNLSFHNAFQQATENVAPDLQKPTTEML